MKLYNIEQAAAVLQVHPETLRTWARTGKIPSFKVGRAWRFAEEDLQRFIEQQRQAHRPEESTQ